MFQRLSTGHGRPIRRLRPHLFLAAGALGLTAIAVQAFPQPAAVERPGPPPTTIPAAAAAKPAAPAFAHPVGATVEHFPIFGEGGRLDELLKRAGASGIDAQAAADLVRQALPAGIPAGTEIRVLVGEGDGKSGRRLERVSFKPGSAFRITIGRTVSGELKLVRDSLNVDARPQKFSGVAAGDLYWSLRGAGVPAQAASEFIEAVSSRVAVGSIGAGARFELVVDHLRRENGESSGGPLLYAALAGAGGPDILLVRWTAGGQDGWFDPRNPQRSDSGLARPVDAQVSSQFGSRLHPILRFLRFHSGVDFSARSGTPVVAAGDGVVSGAGWSGGYGRQVRLAHLEGVATSYSHLSSIAVDPGQRVRRGEVIGYVGSSGLSTGPHLHFEVRKNGRPVDPLGLSMGPPPLSSFDIAALRARAQQLRGV